MPSKHHRCAGNIVSFAIHYAALLLDPGVLSADQPYRRALLFLFGFPDTTSVASHRSGRASAFTLRCSLFFRDVEHLLQLGFQELFSRHMLTVRAQYPFSFFHGVLSILEKLARVCGISRPTAYKCLQQLS